MMLWGRQWWDVANKCFLVPEKLRLRSYRRHAAEQKIVVWLLCVQQQMKQPVLNSITAMHIHEAWLAYDKQLNECITNMAIYGNNFKMLCFKILLQLILVENMARHSEKKDLEVMSIKLEWQNDCWAMVPNGDKSSTNVQHWTEWEELNLSM